MAEGKLTVGELKKAIREKSRQEVKKLLDEVIKKQEEEIERRELLACYDKKNAKDLQPDFQTAQDRRKDWDRRRKIKQQKIVSELKDLRKELGKPATKTLKTTFGDVTFKYMTRKQKAIRKEMRSKLDELKALGVSPASKQSIQELRDQLSSPKKVLVPTMAGTLSISATNSKDKEILEKIDLQEEQLSSQKDLLREQFKAVSENASAKQGMGEGLA